MRRGLKTIAVCVLALAVLLGTVVQHPQQSQAKTVLTMEQARALALKNSSKVEQLENKLETQKVKKTQAEKSLAMRKKSMSTFRWSPLLSFTFPTNPDLAEAHEFAFKATSLQAEIDTINHELTTVKYEIYEQVNTVYLDITALESEASLLEEQISEMEKSIKKNQIRLLHGDAAQADIDQMENKLKSLQAQLTSNQRSLLTKKKRLATLTNDEKVQTDYSFENAYVEADISRTTDLPDLLQYTLDNDQTYYEACMAETTARMSLNLTYQLMEKKFSKTAMSIISNYYYKALRGETLNTKEFKSRYKEFLDEIDRPWTGKKKILFIKIPKEWFKGDIDGSRYVEDEPYALFEAALEYQEARLEKEAVKADIEEQVEEAFDNYISLKNAYAEAVEQTELAKAQLDKDRILNRLGSMTYDEYTSSMENYETLQSEMMDAMKEYSTALYEFDKLTCGGVSKLLTSGALSLTAAEDGNSVLTEETVGGSRYQITQIVQNEEFRLSISLAEDLDGVITHFELWCDDWQIGERTAIDQSIRHLALALESVEHVYLRFYRDDTFVDECEIDASVLSAELDITTAYEVVHDEEEQIGTYTCEKDSVTGTVKLTLSPEAEEQIAYYRIRSSVSENYLVTEEYHSITSAFKYLDLLENDLGLLVVEYYDSEKNLLYTGAFQVDGTALLRTAEAD